MSQLFDALRRGRPRQRTSHQDPDRTARADAVLATLGYRKKRPPSLAKPAWFLALGTLVAIAVAWTLWPEERVPDLQGLTPFARRTPPPASQAPGAATSAPAITPPSPAGRESPTTAAHTPLPATGAPETAAPPAINARTGRAPTDVTAAARGDNRSRSVTASSAARSTSPEPALPPAGPAEVPSAELFGQAVTLHKNGDVGRAESAYRALLQRNELDAQVHNNLGLLYRDRGMVADAQREFERALMINPRYVTARNNYGVLLMGASRLDEAAKQFHQVITQEPRNVDARVNLALVDKAAGRTERAKESLLRALGADPRNAAAHFNLASLYDQSGDASLAAEHYRSFVEHAGPEHAARLDDARARLEALTKPR